MSPPHSAAATTACMQHSVRECPINDMGRYPSSQDVSPAITKIYPRPLHPVPSSPHSRHTRGPDAGPGRRTVGWGRLSSGVGNSAAGPAIMVPPEPDPAEKADRDGRPLGHSILFGRHNGRPLPCNRDAARPGGKNACRPLRAGSPNRPRLTRPLGKVLGHA